MERDDPDIGKCWGWKDQALAKRWWYYGKFLRRRATLVSLAELPYFYALSENYGSLDDYLQEYAEGEKPLVTSSCATWGWWSRQPPCRWPGFLAGKRPRCDRQRPNWRRRGSSARMSLSRGWRGSTWCTQQSPLMHRKKVPWQRPTLPGGCPPSTIGAGGLNCRVRDGTGCFPAAPVTRRP